MKHNVNRRIIRFKKMPTGTPATVSSTLTKLGTRGGEHGHAQAGRMRAHTADREREVNKINCYFLKRII